MSAGGATSEGNWVDSWRSWFLPAEPLKRLFRAKYLYGLRGLARSDRLRLPDGWTRAQVESLCREAEHKRWNVYICERYDNPTAVLNYLGRYLHGGPIGESRLLAFDGDTVTFRYKDYRDRGLDGPRQKHMVLDVQEFIRRYLQHVAPKGFHLVRGYGLYRRGGNTEALTRRLRTLLPVSPQLHAALRPPFPSPLPEPDTCSLCGASIGRLLYPRGDPMPLAA